MLAIREEGRGDPLVLVHGAGTSSAIWRRTMPRSPIAGASSRPTCRATAARRPRGPASRWRRSPTAWRRGWRTPGWRRPTTSSGTRWAAPSPSSSPRATPSACAPGPRRARPGWPPCRAPPPGCWGPWRRPSRSRGAPSPRRSPAARSCAGWRSRAWLATARGCPSSTRARCSRARRARRGSAPGWPARRPRTCGRARRRRAPLGLVWGEHDPVIPPRRIDVIRTRAARRQLGVVPDTAHAPMLERPEAFCAALEDVLAAPALTERQQARRPRRLPCDLQGLLRHGRPPLAKAP